MNKKGVYYLTAFLCGLCVMGVETSASRLLSPYFGSTNLIWTIIISLIMVGLAFGSYLGGTLADKYADDRVLYRFIAVGAVWIALLPLLSPTIISWGFSFEEAILGVQGNFIAAALFSTFILFVPPLLLLGMASPFLAKLCVNDLAHTGVVLARLSVLNTIGSIIGSAAPSFLLIPLLGVKRSFLVMAGLLFLLLIIFWLSDRRIRRRGIVASILCVALLGGLTAITPKGLANDADVVYETDSLYQYLRVDHKNDNTILSSGINSYAQSIWPDTWNENPYTSSGIYTDIFMTLPMMFSPAQDNPVSVLLIGYGGGVLPNMIHLYYGDKVQITSVELDAEMVRLAQEYLHARPEDRVIVDDGRRYMQRNLDTYDLILIDAYQDKTVPQNLVTEEFFALCRDRLKPGGILGVNLASAVRPSSPISMAIGATIRTAFAHVDVLQYPQSLTTNLFICSNDPLNWDLARHGASLSFYGGGFLQLIDIIEADSIPAPEGGEVLTDDKGNAELIQLATFAEA